MSELVISDIYQPRQNVVCNLDCASRLDLESVIAHPATHPDVKRYAEVTLAARVERLAGRIGAAIRLENKLETLYGLIPVRLQW